jgi:ribosome modulation factor
VKLSHAVLGVAIGVSALTGGSILAAAQEPWASPPAQYQRDVQRQGYSDGIEGARKDFQNHRKPNVENRDEYKNPKFKGPDRDVYREAFRQGYEVGVQHIYGGRM